VAAAGPDLIASGSAVFDGRQNEANARFALDTVGGKRSQ
jgi:hypothetical protein